MTSNENDRMYFDVLRKHFAAHTLTATTGTNNGSPVCSLTVRTGRACIFTFVGPTWASIAIDALGTEYLDRTFAEYKHTERRVSFGGCPDAVGQRSLGKVNVPASPDGDMVTLRPPCVQTIVGTCELVRKPPACTMADTLAWATDKIAESLAVPKHVLEGVPIGHQPPMERCEPTGCVAWLSTPELKKAEANRYVQGYATAPPCTIPAPPFRALPPVDLLGNSKPVDVPPQPDVIVEAPPAEDSFSRWRRKLS